MGNGSGDHLIEGWSAVIPADFVNTADVDVSTEQNELLSRIAQLVIVNEL